MKSLNLVLILCFFLATKVCNAGEFSPYLKCLKAIAFPHGLENLPNKDNPNLIGFLAPGYPNPPKTFLYTVDMAYVLHTPPYSKREIKEGGSWLARPEMDWVQNEISSNSWQHFITGKYYVQIPKHGNLLLTYTNGYSKTFYDDEMKYLNRKEIRPLGPPWKRTFYAPSTTKPFSELDQKPDEIRQLVASEKLDDESRNELHPFSWRVFPEVA